MLIKICDLCKSKVEDKDSLIKTNFGYFSLFLGKSNGERVYKKEVDLCDECIAKLQNVINNIEAKNE